MLPKQLLLITVIAFVAFKKDNPARRVKQYTYEQLSNNLSISGADFSPDDSKILVTQNSSGIFNLYELNVADKKMTPLTQSTKESHFAIDYLPGTQRFLFNADEGGNENAHIFLQSSARTVAKDITPWPGSRNVFGGWSVDKKAAYIESNKRDPKFMDVYKLDTATWKEQLFYQNDSGYNINTISDNENFIALSKDITTDKNRLFLLERSTKKMKELSNDNEATWNAMEFDKNRNILYYTTNDGSEFTYLIKYNIDDGKAEKLFETSWDVNGMSLSENGKYHTIFINEDGKNKVLLFDHTTNTQIPFPVIKDGDVQSILISRSEKNMVLTVGSSKSPNNLYLYNFNTKALKQLTQTLNPAIDINDLVSAETVRFKSFDGKEIPAIYYTPLQADKNNKAPALVWVHGGPGGQSRVGFSNSIQYFVNHGYAVLAVNNRGSSGYGKTFYKLDNKKHSEGDLMDCIYGKKWLASQDYIDSSKIGIYGGSYGGCMVLAALAFQPHEFAVGVDLFGVANWLRTLRSIPPYWEAQRKALYDELGDPYGPDSVRLRKISPLFNYEKIRKPLIVFQGANDVRVLKAESDEIVDGVKKNNVPVEYVVFPDEGHGFVKKQNQITTANKTLAFLDKYLKAR
ncbi:MAG: prolyl oligopeptidase family serine peptidase [Segetibacter sp.]